jgi:hypothetical protein
MAFGRGDPTLAIWIVRFIDQAHRQRALEKLMRLYLIVLFDRALSNPISQSFELPHQKPE